MEPTGNLTFKVLGENLFLLDFENDWDKARVMEGRPWAFERNLFAVEEFDGIASPNEIEFNHVAFWIRMFNLPLACMSQKVGFQIGSSVGEVAEVDTDGEGLGWGEYLQIRIKIDISKPLPRGRVLKLQGKTVWVPFKFENLPLFCFHCGLIKHGPVGCLKRSGFRAQGTATKFGPWLRVQSSPRRKEFGWEPWGDREGNQHNQFFEETLGGNDKSSCAGSPYGRFREERRNFRNQKNQGQWSAASSGGGGRYNGNPNSGKEKEETAMKGDNETSGRLNANDDVIKEQTVKSSK
jgi:hypothetical protein